MEDRKYGLPRIADFTTRRLPFDSCPSSRCWRILASCLERHIVGDRRRRERSRRATNERTVGSRIREQCEAAKVPFFFKQWGGVRKKVAGRTLLGRTYDGFPKRVQNPTLPATLRQRHVSEIESGALVQLGTA